MDPIDKSITTSENIVLNDQIKKFILEMAKWAKFLAILGYIALGLAVLGIISILTFTAGMGGGSVGATESLIFIAYFVVLLLYFLPIHYLYKAASRLKRGLESNEETTVTSGFESLKAHYKFIGIFTIVLISLYLLAAVAGAFVYSAM